MQVCFPGDRPALDLQGERRAFQLEALGQPARLGIEHDPYARRKERRELACVFLSPGTRATTARNGTRRGQPPAPNKGCKSMR